MYICYQILKAVKNFCEQKEKSKGAERADVYIPKIIDTYKKTMDGVDKSDQMKKAYEIDHLYKLKYYMQIFDNMLDTMVVNSYLVYLELSRKYNRRPITHFDFRAEVYPV